MPLFRHGHHPQPEEDQQPAYRPYVLLHSLSDIVKRLCENCEEISHDCDANVIFLSYPYLQTSFGDEQDLFIVMQRGSLYMKAKSS